MSSRKNLEIQLNKFNSVFTGNRTYSCLFLPPAFDLNFDSDLSIFLINTYTDDFGIKHAYKRPLFVLLGTENSNALFLQLEKELKENKNFVYSYFAGTNESKLLYMYVFECPDEYARDYDKFMRGEYSEFSLNYKSRFAKVVEDINGKYVESPLYGVIHKTPTLKKKIENLIFVDPTEKLDKNQEYFGKPDPKIEVFRYG